MYYWLGCPWPRSSLGRFTEGLVHGRGTIDWLSMGAILTTTASNFQKMQNNKEDLAALVKQLKKLNNGLNESKPMENDNEGLANRLANMSKCVNTRMAPLSGPALNYKYRE